MAAPLLTKEVQSRPGCCDEIVARSVQVVSERVLAPTDWTHLQFCNAPAVEGTAKCVRHAARPVQGLRHRWRRFVSLSSGRS